MDDYYFNTKIHMDTLMSRLEKHLEAKFIFNNEELMTDKGACDNTESLSMKLSTKSKIDLNCSL
jgi:hypothetical protein